jgi:hypothetical protein
MLKTILTIELECPSLPSTLSVDGRRVSNNCNVWNESKQTTKSLALRKYDANCECLWRTLRPCDSSSSRFASKIFSFNKDTADKYAASRKFKLIALTNNFGKPKGGIPEEEAKYLGWDQGATPNHLRSRFDDFCDSTEFGMRFGNSPNDEDYCDPLFQETRTTLLPRSLSEEWCEARRCSILGRYWRVRVNMPWRKTRVLKI